MGEIAAFSSKIYAHLGLIPSSAHPNSYRTAGQPKGPIPNFREDFVFDPIGEEATNLEVSLVMKDAIQTRVGIDYFLGAASIPLFTLLRKPQAPIASAETSSSSSSSSSSSTSSTSVWRRVDPSDSESAAVRAETREEPVYIVSNLATGEPVSPLQYLADVVGERHPGRSFGFTSSSTGAGAGATVFRSVTDWFPLRNKASVSSSSSSVVPKDAAIQLSLTLTATELVDLDDDQSG